MTIMLPGGLYAATHAASVRVICGDQAPPVHSRGKQFFNVDRWMHKLILGQMVRWAKANPGATPSREDLFSWVMACNVTPLPERAIYIASVPDDLDLKTAMAATGGAYHEGLHTLLSCRRTLKVEDIEEQVESIWNRFDLSVYGDIAMETLGFVEDVRIENRGNELFPGIYQSMCDLQDFILKMEEDGLQNARAHYAKLREDDPDLDEPEHWTEMSTLLSAFRDIGLGYTHTPRGQEALQRYRNTHPEVFELVDSGPIAPLVEQASQLSAEDDLGCVWLTLDLINELVHLDMLESSETAKKLKEQMVGASLPGVLDNNSALALALLLSFEAADVDLPEGEQPWHPYNPSADKIKIAGTDRDRAELEQRAGRLLEDVYGEVQYLRARLHRVIRATAHSGIEHGTRRGSRLSGRHLVETHLSLRMGDMPTRAFVSKSPEIDSSVAAAVVLDQSSSMMFHLDTATKVMIAITEPLSAMRSSDGAPFPVMACGFRDGPSVECDPPDDWYERYHRVDPVIHDIYKEFHEPFREVLWRFADTRSQGHTPMSDGIQLAMLQLRQRREAHKLLFAVTDGLPTGQHARVIRWQIKQAEEQGILIIGVGIGRGCAGVMSLFDDHVWTEDIAGLPEALVRKLNERLDFRRQTRFIA